MTTRNRGTVAPSSALALVPVLLLALVFGGACDDGESSSTGMDVRADSSRDTGSADSRTDGTDTADDDTSAEDAADDTKTSDASDTAVSDTADDTTDSGDTGSGDASDGGDGDDAGTDTVDPGDATDMADGVDPGDPWSHCPVGTDAGEASWTFTLDVQPGADYCRTYPEQRPLTQELEQKIQLRVVPATHTLPMQSGTHSWTLPACARTTDGTTLVSDGAGELVVERAMQSGYDTIDFVVSQPMVASDGGSWTLRYSLSFESSTDPLPTTFTLDDRDASVFDPSGPIPYQSIALCPDGKCDTFGETAFFNSCTFSNASRVRTTRVDFDGGHVEIELRIGNSFASTEPAILFSGVGELDGTAYSQSDYFQLVYSPHHHHFAMDWVVLFDAPIGTACGVKALNVPAFDSDPTTNVEVGLVDCALNDIESRKLVGVSNQTQ